MKFAGCLAVVLMVSCAAYAGTVAGTLTTPSNNVVPNGTLTFTLTQQALIVGTASVVTSPVNCWTDSRGSIAGLPGNAAIAAPAITQSAGGALSGTYFVRYTWAGSTGESEPSAERAVTLSGGNGRIVVQPPSNVPVNAASMKVYIGTVTGTGTLQGSVNITGGALVSGYTQSTLPSTGGNPLANTGTSTCVFRFNDEMVPSFTGYTVDLVNLNGQRIPGFPQKWYLSGGPGGTVNVSSGTPLYSGVVTYPQAIVSAPTNNGLQSISGPLNMNGFPIFNTVMSLSNTGVTFPGSVSGTTTVQAQATASGTLTLPSANDTLVGRATTDTLANKTIAAGGLPLAGGTSGLTTVAPAAVASGTLTLPAATDTLVGRATTDTLTNKTLDTAGAGNVLRINANTVSSVTGSGPTLVLATSPTLTTPTIGAAAGSNLTFTNQTAPTNPGSGQIIIYGDSGSGNLSCRNSSGTSCLSATAAPPIVSGTANPAATGLLRAASGDTAVAFRNAANSADINGLSKTAGDVVQVGGAAGIVSSGPININGQSITNTGTLTLPTSTDTLVGRATTDTLTNKALGGSGSTTPDTKFNRLKASQGGAISCADVGAIINFGTGASCSSAVGTDSAGNINISAGPGGIADGLFTLTFHDGTWTNPPTCVANRSEANGPTAPVETGATATLVTFAFVGSPASGIVYGFNFICVGH